MDDLISKSAVFEAIEDSGLLDTISQPEADLLEETIKNIKVAYNVDKVVEQIKTHNYSDGIGWLALTEVTTIVKAGGVNE